MVTRARPLKDLQSFLGEARYFWRFVKIFIALAWSMTNFLKKNVSVFKWDEEAIKTFNGIKEALTSTPVLALPDFSKPLLWKQTGNWS